MTATIERFLDEVRANPRSSLEMVDLIEEILTRRYLAGDDDNADDDAYRVPRLPSDYAAAPRQR